MPRIWRPIRKRCGVRRWLPGAGCAIRAELAPAAIGPAGTTGWLGLWLTEFPKSFQDDVALGLPVSPAMTCSPRMAPFGLCGRQDLHHHLKDVRIAASALVRAGIPI